MADAVTETPTAGQEWVDTARLRQALHRVFAVALQRPTPARIEGLQLGADYVAGCDVEAFAFASAWQRFDDVLADGPDIGRLEQEHIRLFEAGVDGALCPPIESFHLASARDGGAATLIGQLEATYSGLGLRTTSDGIGLPDHIATEFETLSVLCGLEYEARQAGDAAGAEQAVARQRRFLDDHLGRWYLPFTARLRSSTTLDYYRALSTAIEAFLRHEVQLTALLALRPVSEARP